MKLQQRKGNVKGGMTQSSPYLCKLIEIALGIAALELLFYLFRAGAAVYAP
jgi:hypothetical protein